MLSVTGAVIAVIGDGQHRGAIAVSDRTYVAVDDLQFSLGEGPCIAADRSAGPVLEPDLDLAVDQWPAFVPAAVGHGVRAAFAFPLRMGAVHVGVLSLYRDSGGHWTARLADGGEQRIGRSYVDAVKRLAGR